MRGGPSGAGSSCTPATTGGTTNATRGRSERGRSLARRASACLPSARVVRAACCRGRGRPSSKVGPEGGDGWMIVPPASSRRFDDSIPHVGGGHAPRGRMA
eukprot:scaffold3115_cov335-Prasinococcus_capsulatus_cf.AAC.1